MTNEDGAQGETKTYPLPLRTLPHLHVEHRIGDLKKFQTFLNNREIQTKNTRIERYLQYLTRVAEKEPFEPGSIFKNSADIPFDASAQVNWTLYVLREVDELMWILRGFGSYPVPGLEKRLAIIVSGRDFAAQDRESQSRNTQFELRIASYFSQTGCTVDLSTETDVIARSDSEAYYVECKRIASENQLVKRLSEAKRQLNARVPKKHGRHTVFACVALDVTKVAFSHNGLTWAMTNEHSRDVIQEKLLESAKLLKGHLLFDDCRHLSDYWLQIHIPSLIFYPPTTLTRFSSYHYFKTALSPREKRAARSFRAIFETASKGDPRESPGEQLALKKTIRLPAGTELGVYTERVMDFIEKGIIGTETNQEIAYITIDGRHHVFGLSDLGSFFSVLPPKFRSATAFRKALENDPGGTRLELVTELYRWRFPYEEVSNAITSVTCADSSQASPNPPPSPPDARP